MPKIKDWTAKRAGAHITITGVDATDGSPVKVVGVETIEAGKSGKPPVARDNDGGRYELI